MPLFFDDHWFTQKLSQRGQSRADFARALNIDDAALAMIWKDQRTMTPQQMAQAARFLDVSETELREHAGRGAVQKLPEDQNIDIPARLDHIAARLEAIERALKDLRHIVLAHNMPSPPK